MFTFKNDVHYVHVNSDHTYVRLQTLGRGNKTTHNQKTMRNTF